MIKQWTKYIHNCNGGPDGCHFTVYCLFPPVSAVKLENLSKNLTLFWMLLVLTDQCVNQR